MKLNVGDRVEIVKVISPICGNITLDDYNQAKERIGKHFNILRVDEEDAYPYLLNKDDEHPEESFPIFFSDQELKLIKSAKEIENGK